ncbi:MAG: tRNA 2-thiouridine(34) synthase MnmA [Clostridia bacterium]|nr:tRNA 2-thiouridine(34) synthase MnmA [Clostridia bacterium]
MKKVAIGMSGGVDSSVAAAMLLEKGYEVIGITMLLCEEGACLSSVEEDARKVCENLGIEHHVVDFRGEFKEKVVDYFVDEYLAGRTPNPCIACNKHLKFDAMLEKAKELGADYIATGHYAKVLYNEDTGRYYLKQSDASEKDQTYVLYNLKQEQLKRLLMPLGDVENKEEVRKYAEKLGLSTAGKPDSMEICFIPDNDYAGFIERNRNYKATEGDFVDKNGEFLGKHKGIIHYTVGQRKGLGVTFGKPMFVTKIDAENNRVVLGEKGEEFSKGLLCDNLNFITVEKITEPIKVWTKVRYSAKPALATLSMVDENTAKVVFDQPQRAVTPGQAVVFYDDENIVIGGGIIK